MFLHIKSKYILIDEYKIYVYNKAIITSSLIFNFLNYF